MKKKAIEKIPYFGLEKISRKKQVKYIGVTGIKIVGHEKHLFLEVYRNQKESKDTPLVRIVLTKKDFGTYRPESGEWTRQYVRSGNNNNGRLIWNSVGDSSYWEWMEKENILQSLEDLERIKKFCGTTVWRGEGWWEYIDRRQSDIATEVRRKAERRKYQRRPYPTVDVAQYLAKKFKIGVDADGQEDS